MNQIESKELFDKIFSGKMSESEILEILISLHQKGETAEEIAGAMESMSSHSVKVLVDPEFRDKIVDNCGTGGDKSNSFNISTTTSFVLSGAGMSVAKHGNRSITSRSGSADVLEKLGFNFNLSPMQHAVLLQNSGFTFMFAQNHHPAMKWVMPVRKSLPHRTIFNILGPLTNPAGVEKQLVGVFQKELLEPVGKALKLAGKKSGIVVSGDDGLDEVSISANSQYFRFDKGEFGEIVPENYGLKRADISEIRGGDSDENAKILLGILNGEISGAKRDIALLNSAVALWSYREARDIKEGLEMSRESIDSKKALHHFNLSKELSHTI
ncbi:anthranilate phosphoribosyltransferase [Thiovulum sp. ES]|nr:anthranilate phosphoribosyltransferase [Thiovulum sp. ES]